MKSDEKNYLINFHISENVHKMLKKEAAENNVAISRQAALYIEKILYEKYPDYITIDDFTNERVGAPRNNSKMTNRRKRPCVRGLCRRLCGFISYENRNKNIKIADSMNLSEGELLDIQIKEFRESNVEIDTSRLTFRERRRDGVKRIHTGFHITVQSCNFIEEITNLIACSNGAILDYIIEWWQNKNQKESK